MPVSVSCGQTGAKQTTVAGVRAAELAQLLDGDTVELEPSLTIGASRSATCPQSVGTNMSQSLGHRAFHCFRIAVLAMSGLYRRSKCLLSGIFCGNWNPPHIACSFQGAQVLSGRRNCIRSNKRSHRSRPKRAHNDKGSVSSHNSGMNRARISFQKELHTKLSSHHWRQRFKVLGSIFSISRMRRTRSGFRPCIIAETNTTIRPA